MGKKRLFDEAEADNDEAVLLSVNEEYAARLTHNKRREELHRLQDKHAALQAAQTDGLGGGADEEDSLSSSSGSSTDDDDDIDVHKELQDAEFLRTLAWARGKVGNAGLGPGQATSEPTPTSARTKSKKHKPILLKDVAAMEAEDSDEDRSGSHLDQPRPYVRVLENFRQSLIQAADASGQEAADLFSEPGKGAVGQPVPGRQGQRSMQELLDQYFGRDEELGEDDLFLKRFVSQQGIGEDGSGRPAAEWLVEDDQEDEAFLEAADRFEAQHNFRFEEPDSGFVKTYPRRVDNVVRQADTKRAEVRARKKQRKQEEKAELVSEVQRMKTLKRQEVEESLREIRKYAGLDASDEALGDMLEAADFDGEEYDKAMEKVFGPDYYQADDDEEEILQTEVAESSEGEDTVAAGGFRAKRRQLAATTSTAAPPKDTARVQQLLAEYNQLDYEDIVAGIPTRFSYREVPKETFGLSTADILSLSDKELNQVVGLRKIAPYREERNPRKAHFQTMHRLRNLASSAAQPPPSSKSMEPKPPMNSAQAPVQKLQPSSARLASYARPKLREGPQQRSAALDDIPGKAKAAKQAKGGSPAIASTLTKVQKRNARRTRLRSLGKEPDS